MIRKLMRKDKSARDCFYEDTYINRNKRAQMYSLDQDGYKSLMNNKINKKEQNKHD